MNKLVIIKGGGDLATGIAHRLHRCGFDIVITEIACPTVIRRSVAFASAIYQGQAVVEGVQAVFSETADIRSRLRERMIPVVVDPACAVALELKPWGLVDAILAKTNTGTALTDASVVVGVGPGFTAGVDVHRVVETLRGHDLGRVYSSGAAIPNTGVPGDIGGYTSERLVLAPASGIFVTAKSIGDIVTAGDVLGFVGTTPVIAAISGVVRGLLIDGLEVHQHMKIGDVDPRAKAEHCWSISDKARSVGGGVLEALLMEARCFQLPSVSGGNSPTEHKSQG